MTLTQTKLPKSKIVQEPVMLSHKNELWRVPEQ